MSATNDKSAYVNPSSPLDGRRITPDGTPSEWGPFEPGDYQIIAEAGDAVSLFFRDPFGSLGAVRPHSSGHVISESADGSITVEPSIAPRDNAPPGSFHGWLKNGRWTW